MKQTRCLGCGEDMQGRFFSICPRCGRYMATRPIREILTIFIGGFLFAIVFCIGLVVLLWKFA